MTMLAGMLEFCGCGHSADEHIRGGECVHVNHDGGSKQRTEPRPDELCGCHSLTVDPRLADGEAFVAKVLNKLVAKEGVDVESVRDDLLQVMLISLWRASAKYDSRSHIRFGDYAAFEVYNDAIDEIRSSRLYGRHGQYRVFDPRTVADGADEHAGREQVSPDGEESDRAGWFDAGGGMVGLSDRRRARREDADDPGVQGRDRDRDDRAGARARGRAGRAVAGTDRGARRRAFVDCLACGWRSYLQSPNGMPGWHEPETCAGCGATLTSEAA